MTIDEIKQELITRYNYLYENKELILSLCIEKGIRKEYHESAILDLKKLINRYMLLKTSDKKVMKRFNSFISLENKEVIDLLNSCISRHEKALCTPRYYLMNNISNEIVDLFEKFLLGDNSIENTDLYSLIESIKLDENKFKESQNKIKELIERRREEEFLQNKDCFKDCFTVWKILTYVKDKNKENKEISDALDKYYNIDRYINTGINWNSGYKLLDEDVEENEDFLYRASIDFVYSGVKTISGSSGVVWTHKDNEFEKEDDYFSFDIPSYSEELPLRDNNLSFFVLKLNSIGMLDEDEKYKLYLEMQNKSKSNSLQRTSRINN